MSRGILLCFLLWCVVTGVLSQFRPCDHPIPKPPAYWEDNANCQRGGSYQTSSNNRIYHCRCWGLCGYICQTIQGGGGGGGGDVSTSAAPVSTSTIRTQSPCPHGGIWHNPLLNVNCYCQSFMRVPYYVCVKIIDYCPSTFVTSSEGSTLVITDSTYGATGSTDGATGSTDGATGSTDGNTGSTEGSTSEASTETST